MLPYLGNNGVCRKKYSYILQFNPTYYKSVDIILFKTPLFPINSLLIYQNNQQFLPNFPNLVLPSHFHIECRTVAQFLNTPPFVFALHCLIFFVRKVFPEIFSFLLPFHLTIIAICYIIYTKYSVMLSSARRTKL